MQNLFGLLFFILIILSIVGIFKPQILKQTSRLKGFLYPFAGAFVSLAMVGVFAPTPNVPSATKPVENNSTTQSTELTDEYYHRKITEEAGADYDKMQSTLQKNMALLKEKHENENPNLGEIMGRTWKPPFSMETIAKWGGPETLEGTNSQVWIAYFPKGDFTILSQKGLHSQIVDFAKEGKVLDWSKELKLLGL